MEDPDANTSAAAAGSSGCNGDKPQQENENPTTIVASSQPSTSDANPVQDALVASYEAGYYSDDATQVSEKPLTPLIGDKVTSWLYGPPMTSAAYHFGPTSNPNRTAKLSHASSIDSGYRVSSSEDDNYDDYALGSSDDANYDLGTQLKKNYDSVNPNDGNIALGRPAEPLGPLISQKEPLSTYAAELEKGIMREKAELLMEKYAAVRRSRGDGSCFFRSFMFSYLEHILLTQDIAEVERVLVYIERCRVDLFNLGYAEFTYEDFFTSFTELLDSCLSGTEASLSLNELLEKACDQSISNDGVMFLRFITSSAIQRRADFFAPFISGISELPVVQFCKKRVEPMKEESEEVHVIALSDALGVPIRVVYLDNSISGTEDHTANHHDFFPSADNNGSNKTDAANVSTDLSMQEDPVPFVTLLYRPGHYDILYPI